MLILSNCLTREIDEGSLKVANSLVKRLNNKLPQTTVVSYDRKNETSDYNLTLNKFLLNKKLISLIKSEKNSVLYIPFPAKMRNTAIRIFILSLFCKKNLSTLLIMNGKADFFAKLLLKLSRSKIFVLSRQTAAFYEATVSKKKVFYLKSGVDTKRFVPVSAEKQQELKKKYGFENKPVILHVGHLKESRNIAELKKISENYQVLLVASTQFADEKDNSLKVDLLKSSNIKILDEYIDSIEEIYQLCDAYIFPVKQSGGCIDSPLSILEAAACNKPIITTAFGEAVEFNGKNGFYFIDSFEQENLNNLIKTALESETVNSRECVLEYDWDKAVDYIINNI